MLCYQCAAATTLTRIFAQFIYLKGLAHFSPLKPEIIGEGIDIMIIRELVGGLYFGHKETGINEDGRRYVSETLEYNEDQIKRIMKVAFQTAQKRKKVLHNIHKSNVLKSSVLWNEVCLEVGQDFPDVEVINILVDAAATYLCLNPGMFDVMVMENMFGDILSDQGGGILGSLGLNAFRLHRPRQSLLRTITWLSTRHCWPKHSQPLFHDRFCGDDARNEF